MLIDCFLFYNEIDLLKYRLYLLDDLVDFFVIVEATHTFVGNTKELFFEKYKKDFEFYNKKIIHIIVHDMPNENNPWENECHQRNCISRGLNKLNLEDDTIIMISDVDEIPDPKFLLLNMKYVENIHVVHMDLYWYNLNRRNNLKIWKWLKICKNKFIKDKRPQDIRNGNHSAISNDIGGWHLSYFGDVDFIHNKLSNFSHQEKAVQSINTLEEIEKRMKNGEDLYNKKRNFNFEFVKTENNNNLPPYYYKFLGKYIKN